jgi:hypothetical protein
MRLIIISIILIHSVFGFGCKSTVREGNIIPKPNNIDVAKLKPGFYFLRFQSKSEVFTKSYIKE